MKNLTFALIAFTLLFTACRKDDDDNSLTKETKLVLGIYGAEIMLSNGTSKKLKKSNVRSFRLMDMDFSVRNYIKYEVDIDGARITLEYVIERTTKK